MSLIKPIFTALPFHRLPNTFNINTGPQKPFYFQKSQCERDCHFATITDKSHLPSFIVRIPKVDGVAKVGYTSSIDFEVMCSDGSNVETITPIYSRNIIAFIQPSDEAIIEAEGPTNGDTYIIDYGNGVYEQITWFTAFWLRPNSGVTEYSNGTMIYLTSENFAYIYSENDSVWNKTLNGFQLCDLEDETLLIYNGFEISEISCGIKHVRLNIDNQPDSLNYFISELIDIRDFDVDNNEYHKLTVNNEKDLGNIPFSGILYEQVYYFHSEGGEGIVGIPEDNIDEKREEDGLGNEKLIYRKVSKEYTLDTLGVPEYIKDFFLFTTQLDDVRITFPYETDNSGSTGDQYKGERCINTDTFEAKGNWGETGCYDQVKFTFQLEFDNIMTNCGQVIGKDECLDCGQEIIGFAQFDEQLQVEAIPPSNNDSYIILVPSGSVDDGNDWFNHPNEIASWVNGAWSYEVPEVNRCVLNLQNGINRDFFYTTEGEWRGLGSCHSSLVNYPSAGVMDIELKGYLPEGTDGYVYTRQNGTFAWIFRGQYTAAQLLASIPITGFDSTNTYKAKILVISNNCDYGYGPESPNLDLVPI